MSAVPAASRSAAAGGGGRAGLLALVALAVLGVAGLLLAWRAIPLERSAIGFDGLGVWLARNGVAVEKLLPAADDPKRGRTLRILAVLDDNIHLALADETYDADAERLGTLAPQEIDEAAVERKLADASTLVVLPKWRRGVVDRGRVHPDLLIPVERTRFFIDGDAVARPQGEDLRTLAVRNADDGGPAGAVTLYRPQVLGSYFDEYCTPIWQADGAGTLVARCDATSYEGSSFTVLSDPDLLDNHGLALGDNAAMALKLAEALAPGGRPVFVDPGLPEGDAGSVGGEDPHQRSFADLERFFRYPFSLAWAGFGLLTLLALWRGNRRFGAPRRDESPAGLRSKRDTIVASGRLIRLSGNEDELFLAYARSRMENLSDLLLGRRARLGGDAAAAVLRFLGSRAPNLGERLGRAHAELVSPAAPRRAALLAPFETVYREILHEFGRTALPQRRDRR